MSLINPRKAKIINKSPIVPKRNSSKDIASMPILPTDITPIKTLKTHLKKNIIYTHKTYCPETILFNSSNNSPPIFVTPFETGCLIISKTPQLVPGRISEDKELKASVPKE